MKQIIIKYSLLLPLLLFFIWTGLTIMGCISCFLDVGDAFYCTKYCAISKTVVTLVLVIYAYFFGRDLYLKRKE